MAAKDTSLCTASQQILDDAHNHAAAVVTSDTVDLTNVTTGLYIGVAGDVKVDMLGGETGITFKAVPIGILKIRATRVYATGTAATNLVALWR